jgi:hypothetical protein
MISDLDIYQANLLIGRYGSDAPIEAALPRMSP